MGGFYLSLQARSDDLQHVAQALEKLCTKYSANNMRLYFAEPINGWIGIYPLIDEISEKLAKDLSGEINSLVLLLSSFDEDDFNCQFYRDNKLTGELIVGGERSNTDPAAISKALDNLSQICDSHILDELKDYLAQSEDIVFHSQVLMEFCRYIGILNALMSFDYIAKQDLEGMEVETKLTPLPTGEWKSLQSFVNPATVASAKLFDMDSLIMQDLIHLAIATEDWQNNPQLAAQFKVLETYGITKAVIEKEIEKYKQNPTPERDKKIQSIIRAMKMGAEAQTYNGPVPDDIKLPSGQILTAESSVPEMAQALLLINRGEWQPAIDQLAAIGRWMKEKLSKLQVQNNQNGEIN